MALLIRYLKKHWPLVFVALLLAAVNQIFSLLDPLIFRHIIDQYATKFHQYSTGEFIRGVSLLLGAAVGVAFVSRVAKNFQDYYVNLTEEKVDEIISALERGEKPADAEFEQFWMNAHPVTLSDEELRIDLRGIKRAEPIQKKEEPVEEAVPAPSP